MFRKSRREQSYKSTKLEAIKIESSHGKEHQAKLSHRQKLKTKLAGEVGPYDLDFFALTHTWSGALLTKIVLSYLAVNDTIWL